MPAAKTTPAPLEALVRYVPSPIVHRFVGNPAPPRSPTAERFPTAVLFADISGFTALTELLAQQHDAAGAEELVRLLNVYFGQLIDVVIAHGGDVTKFAGDALLAFWPALATDEDLPTVTRRAAQCGLAVQTMLHDYEATEGVRLSLRVSIGAGEVSMVHVGGVLRRWEFMVAGAPLVQASLAKQHAQPGEVVLSPEAWRLVHHQCLGQLLPVGHMRLDAVHTPLPVQPATPLTLRPELDAALRTYIPAAILPRLTAGQSEWLAELRQVTVLFINLPDLGYTTPLARAQTVMRGLQAALYRYEGSINKLSVDDKGVTLVAVLGLPPLSHEDDAVRGVQAALAMQGTLRGLGVRGAFGVTTGRAFCGPIGNAMRCEYTVMGDVVNLAARLMQAAPDDVLCDAATYQVTQGRLRFDALPAIRVKGKLEPVAVYRPREQAHKPVDSYTSSIGQTMGQRTSEGVMTSRLDHLPPEHQLLLKVASVIGRVFSWRILCAIHPIYTGKASLAAAVTALLRADLILPHTPEPDVAYRFRYGITQKVMYNRMLFVQRRQLHRAVAEWYEHTYANDLAPLYPLLAHHWSMAEDAANAIAYTTSLPLVDNANKSMRYNK
jgi:class 3 adenylate cyclase